MAFIEQRGLQRPMPGGELRIRWGARTIARCCAIIVEVYSCLSAEQVIGNLDAAQIANAHMNDMHDAWQHEQLNARRRWVDIATPARPLPALLPPGAPDAASVPMDAVPALGQHTDAILAIGCTSEQIAALRAAKAIRAP